MEYLESYTQVVLTHYLSNNIYFLHTRKTSRFGQVLGQTLGI